MNDKQSVALIDAAAWIFRMLFGLVLGSVVVAALFLMLSRTIDATIDVSDMRLATRIEFSRMRKDTEVASKRELRPERERPPDPPQIPRMSFSARESVESNVVHFSPAVGTGSAMSKVSLSAGSDRSTVPLVRISPDYPQRALMSGLEGWVQVQFTITGVGLVKDVVVVRSSNKIFEEPAVKAILRWRYSPKIENGVAVDSVGVQTIIRFTMES